jgi:alpha-D-ribose 1-methylphosphonate 5-triphosphate synthase subunit PhnH
MKPLDPKPCSVTQFDVICHPAQTYPDKGINLVLQLRGLAHFPQTRVRVNGPGLDAGGLSSCGETRLR